MSLGNDNIGVLFNVSGYFREGSVVLMYELSAALGGRSWVTLRPARSEKVELEDTK